MSNLKWLSDSADRIKGTNTPTHSFYDIPIINSPLNSIALPTISQSPFSRDIINTQSPKNIEFRNRYSNIFVDQYTRAGYYFYNCSILSTVILRIISEILRDGIEWVPKFLSKCPVCAEEYHKTAKRCTMCGFEGEMLRPDPSQKKLLINWQGVSLFDECNAQGWDLYKLTNAFLLMSLVYNQPLILCKSRYIVDENDVAIDEIPQEFVTLAPTKVKRIFDDRGQPGNDTGFMLRDRFQTFPLDDREVLETGFKFGKKLYPVYWGVSEVMTSTESNSEYFAKQEIYNSHFVMPSATYGVPIPLLIETDIKAHIALELRIEKFYSTGHPPGVFVIHNATRDSIADVSQSIKLQMQNDPFTLPIIGIPSSSDKTASTKWIPFADNPTVQMIEVKKELQERIASPYGVTGMFIGDSDSIRGQSNEQHQLAVMDRNLSNIRHHTNSFLNWIVRKYRYITDWTIRVVEPPDDQSKKEAETFEIELRNAVVLKELGFEVISQEDGKIEMSSTPKKFDPLKALIENSNQEAGATTPAGDNPNPFAKEQQGDLSKNTSSQNNNLSDFAGGGV